MTMKAEKISPASIAKLADAMMSADPVVSKAGKMDLEVAAHAAAAPGNGPVRAVMASALVLVANSNRPRLVRAHALKLIGFVGAKAHATGISKLSNHPEIGQDTKIAIRRISAGK